MLAVFRVCFHQELCKSHCLGCFLPLEMNIKLSANFASIVNSLLYKLSFLKVHLNKITNLSSSQSIHHVPKLSPCMSFSSHFPYLYWHCFEVRFQAVVSAAIFLIAILAFLVVDIYHCGRRASLAYGYNNNYWNFFRYPFSRHGHYYRWQIGRMIRMHIEDAILVGLYLLAALTFFALLTLWMAQHWLARWILG